MEYFFPFLLFCIVTTVSPGPNNIMIMTSGLNYGIRQSLAHYAGIVFGFPLMVFLVGFCLGDLIAQFPLFHHILDVVGIVYLLYLAWKIANAGSPKASKAGQQPLSLLQALSFQWVNVKAWIMIIAVVAAYMTSENFIMELLIVTATFFVVGIFNSTSWLFLVHHFTAIVRQRMFNFAVK